jgi:hypothetical protein
MVRHWLKPLRQYLLWCCAALLATAGATRAGDDTAELRALLQEQQKQIEELKKQIQSGGVRPAADKDGDKLPTVIEEDSIRKIVAAYLKDNPGAGMPPSVQTGYSTSTGFAIRSVNDPAYVKWEDDLGKVPFELRIKGRIQADYYRYKVTDTLNHQTGLNANATGDNSAPDFSALEIKRARLFFEGSLFTPDLRYLITFDGNTRGINALDPRQNALGNPIGNVEGGQATGNVDHAVRLFQAAVFYDWHPCSSEKGCGQDCCEGTYRYAPTITFLAGKWKPLFGLEEYLGSGNQQFVEYSMANWFFDAEDDNMMMMAGITAKFLEDRGYLLAVVTNGNETQIPALQMDDLPGINIGGWYDFGGTWNEAKHRWDLYGDSISDIDYSCCPVARVGGAVNLVPMDRRAFYTQAELDRVRAMPGLPNASGALDGILNGAGVASGTAGTVAGVSSPFEVDAFDSWSYNVFWGAKYKGFSLYQDLWLRDVDNFRGTRIAGTNLNRDILYNSTGPGGTSVPSLFPQHKSLIDYGTTVQAGYFIIPKKLEVAARFSWISGQSGDINGNGTFTTLSAAQRAAAGIPTAAAGGPAVVRVVNGAFTNFHEAQEIAVGVNYYFYRQLVKWQTDVSFYSGGNPAANGQSPAGFIPGADGYMLRTQVQLGW